MIIEESKVEENLENNEFETKVLKYLNDRVKKWKKETNVGFTLKEMTVLE